MLIDVTEVRVAEELEDTSWQRGGGCRLSGSSDGIRTDAIVLWTDFEPCYPSDGRDIGHDST